VYYHKRGESRVTGKPAAEVGPGKAVGEGGWEERENQMSKGGEVDQFHE